MAVSESQKRASQKWDAENKEKKKYIMLKSQAKRFISLATKEDLEFLKYLIKEREENEIWRA